MKRTLFLILAALSLEARTLKWDELAVRARLDERGNLHVREQQTMVFDGDWNGGERLFRLEPEQTLTFHRMSRVDANGAVVPMQQYGLDQVDHWEFTDEKTLRWRSRLPDAPPFESERITYVLEYTLGNILVASGDRYRLQHDFAFPNREGVIERFTLDLELDQAWRAPGLETRRTAGPLQPGRGFVVTADLEFTGGGAPDARRNTFWLRLPFALALIPIAVFFWRRLVRHETKIGRLEPVDPRDISRATIERELLPVRAELVGAAWDESVSATEVSALLARWTADEKISTDNFAGELTMKLLVPRSGFEDGYERELVDKLFFDGDKTSTEAIRTHYASEGFDPSAVIRKPLTAQAEAIVPSEPDKARPSLMLSLILLAASFIPFILELTSAGPSFAAIAPFAIILLSWGAGAAFAQHWRGRIDYGLRQTRGIRITIAVITVTAMIPILVQVGWFARVGIFLLAITTIRSICNVARSRRGARAVAFRRRLAAMRNYFIEELKKKKPSLDDRWYPYIIAFGLDDQATAWMEEFGAKSTTEDRHSFTSSSSTGGSSSSGWSGGGGAFGGAGASGSWVAAAAGIAAGVSAPGSSGGGSGGGGGSSSSGGGGGGGW